MARGSRRLVPALLALLVGASGCLLFTAPINKPLQVTIERDQTEPVQRGAPFRVRAVVKDTDESMESLKYRWVAVPTACAAEAPMNLASAAPTTGLVRFSVQGNLTTDKFCVWVRVEDSHGATATSYYEDAPVNRAPEARLVLVSPAALPDGEFQLYQLFHLSAAGSRDDVGERLAFEFMATGPGGPPIRTDCPGEALDSEYCFVADRPGPYSLIVDVSDALSNPGGAALVARSPEVKVMVKRDQLPCIDLTFPDHRSPIVRNPESTDLDDRTYKVDKVLDDGDPFPQTAGITFAWWVGKAGQALQQRVPTTGMPGELVLGAEYRTGDRIVVRVEVSDRNPTAAQNFMVCGPEPLTCEAPKGSGCLQRVSWDVEFR